MLRVRPVHFTSRMEPWEQLLTVLGLAKTADDGSWREFDAGAGRLALHLAEAGAPNDGTTVLGVEVGDLAEFARRTNQAGPEAGSTPAELIDTDHGESCRITGQDSFSFLADPAARTADGSWATSQHADGALAVVGVWFTEEPAAAAQTLRDIGARFRPVPDDDETADFTAKNGGVLMVRPASGPPRSGLGFEYDGDLDTLRDRLTAAGHEVGVTEEAFSRTLHIANPDAAVDDAAHGTGLPVPPTLWISTRRIKGSDAGVADDA
ncbi:VOC family protein [Arthrobacter sp. ISL-48]|uniref:VOC family protein n=1 Tax=Arthrobacter sp. ISL-48 TaxID=2819110 RepID=UPI001BEC4E99|nr:VOC family protein [Arthrobacter sp. ISL-48]MBT2531234.1 VOC family protein [Arthrobacter sp. ISL-48]